MGAIYEWARSTMYYTIFLSVANNPPTNSKYDKHIRFFSGMVLILPVVSPFTGRLHLGEQIPSMFKSISFQNDMDDLKQDFWGMEGRRLDQVIREYEQVVAADMEVIAKAEGPECTGASVQADGDRNSSHYGRIEGTDLVIGGEEADAELDSWDYMGSRPADVDVGRIDGAKVEDVELGELPETGGVGDNGDTSEQGEGEAGGMAADKKISHLTGKTT